MKRLIAAILIVSASILSVAACSFFQPTPSVYDVDNYSKLSWAKHPFDENRARCRYDSSARTKKYGSYEVRLPLYKACMERYGWHYNGKDETVKRSSRFYASPSTPVAVKSQNDIQWNKTPAEIDAAILKASAVEKTEAVSTTIKADDKSALYR